MDDFGFKCVCGAAPERPRLDVMPWASFAGFGSMGSLAWKADLDSARHPDWVYGQLRFPPIVGMSYWVRLSMPFAGRADEPFWCLYEPLDAALNGFEEVPELLNDLLLVEGYLSDLESTTQGQGTARLHVQKVLTVADLLALPRSHHPIRETLWRDHPMPDPILARCGDLVLMSGQFEGDLGIWALMRDTTDATDLLILSSWGEHEDVFWAGHTRLRDGNTLIGAGVPMFLTDMPS